MTMVERLIEYFDKNPTISAYNKNKGYVGIEWLDTKDASFNIVVNPLQGDGSIQKDVLGNKVIQYSVMLNTMFPYSSDVEKSIANHKFFEDIREWVEQNNKDGVFPVTKEKQIPIGVFVQQTPYLFGIDPSNMHAQYSIIFQFQYRQLK